MRILLIRHGQTDYNIKDVYQGAMDVPLNDKGHAQAGVVAERLKGFPVRAIYSSPLRRARATLDRIAAHHKPEPVFLDDLKEIHLGEWQGKSDTEVKRRYASFFEERKRLGDYYEARAPGGESYKDLTERSLRALERIVAEVDEGPVLVVTHGGVIKSIIGHLFELSVDKRRVFEIYNTSITTLDYDPKAGAFKIITINDAVHMGAKSAKDAGLSSATRE